MQLVHFSIRNNVISAKIQLFPSINFKTQMKNIGFQLLKQSYLYFKLYFQRKLLLSDNHPTANKT